MATADSVKANLQNIIAKANNATGENYADVDSAVDTLISGFGQGGGITPSGTKTITENGTHDVTSYANAIVNVTATEEKTVVRTVTLEADVTGTGETTTLLTDDEFIKEHYADEGFSVTAFLSTPAASEIGVLHFSYHGNKNIGSSNVTRTGIALKSTSASALGMLNHTAAINGKGYNVHFRVDSSGNLKWYLATGNTLKAGTYQIILTCTT